MTEAEAEIREHIEDVVSDLVSDFLYYDRKSDDTLRRGDIEEAVRKHIISVDDIVKHFRSEVEARLRGE